MSTHLTLATAIGFNGTRDPVMVVSSRRARKNHTLVAVSADAWPP